jgi:hypothetical protein
MLPLKDQPKKRNSQAYPDNVNLNAEPPIESSCVDMVKDDEEDDSLSLIKQATMSATATIILKKQNNCYTFLTMLPRINWQSALNEFWNALYSLMTYVKSLFWQPPIHQDNPIELTVLNNSTNMH